MFLDQSLVWEGYIARVHYASASTCPGYLFRLPPCHTYTLDNFFGFVISEGRRYSLGELCFCFDWSRVILQGATMPPLHPRKIYLYWSSHLCGEELDIPRMNYAAASTFLWYCFRVRQCPPYILEKSKRFWSRPWERDSHSQHKWGLRP